MTRNQSRLAKKTISLLVAALSLLAIYLFSSQTGAQSGANRALVVDFLVRVLGPAARALGRPEMWLESVLFSRFDMIAHYSVYVWCSLSLMLALRAFDIRLGWSGLWTLLIVAVYAASDEWHQSFVPGRVMDIVDWCVDLAGALTGIAVWSFFAGVRARLTRRGKRASRTSR